MLTFHADLGRTCVLLADSFAMLLHALQDPDASYWAYEHRVDMFFTQCDMLRYIGNVVKLAAGQPL